MKKKKQSIIWRIRHPEVPHSSYLIGTMHVRDARAFERLEDMESCIDSCEVFAAEFNLAEANHNLSAEQMDLPEGQTLPTLLGERKYAKIRESLLRSFDLDIAFLKKGLPILSINMVTEKILSDDMQDSLDRSLWVYAQGQGKIMMGIETFEEQMEILDNIPLEYQLKQLKELAKKPEKFRLQTLRVSQLYAQGDIQKLYQWVRKSAGSIRKAILYDRNVIMAERVGRIVQERSLCYAVGAGHLAGKKGLIRLLKMQGFKVSPLYSRPD